MEFNPTQSPVRVCEDYFDVETLSMAKEGYANRRDGRFGEEEHSYF